MELQKRIERYLSDCALNPNCSAPAAAVVLDVPTSDILALVSLPAYDLNAIRTDYAEIASDPGRPLLNRAINQHYPPGSVIKPVILIAALESAQVGPHEAISCGPHAAPNGWPNCWIYNQYGTGHDDQSGGRENYSRNAIKGSCNIYFSRIADRLEPRTLQEWLFKFGYGRRAEIDHPGPPGEVPGTARKLRQVPGCISSVPPEGGAVPFDRVPPLRAGERRYFGIGQGNLRVTPLQVANAMAALARGGLFMPPQLFLDGGAATRENNRRAAQDLGISESTLNIVRDGMSAVVNEPGGTAYSQFAHSGLAERQVDVFGKTGSTEAPENAWFAGFATDRSGRGIAIAVVVEGAGRGSTDAAPLARDIIGFCIESGHLGRD
jgi:penicillin-binding protein 2